MKIEYTTMFCNPDVKAIRMEPESQGDVLILTKLAEELERAIIHILVREGNEVEWLEIEVKEEAV